MISLVRGAATTMNSMRVHLEASPTTRVTRASGDRAAVYNALVLQYMEQRRTVESFFSKIHEIRSVHEFVDVAALNSLPTVIRIQSNSFSSINEFNFMNHSNTSGSSNHMNNSTAIRNNTTAATDNNNNHSNNNHSNNHNHNYNNHNYNNHNYNNNNNHKIPKGTFLTTSSFNSVDLFRDSVFASFDHTTTAGISMTAAGGSNSTSINGNNSGGWFDEDDEDDKEHDDDIDKFASFSGFSENHFDSFVSNGDSNGFGGNNTSTFGSNTSFGSGGSFGSFGSNRVNAIAAASPVITNSAKKGRSKLLNIHEEKEGDLFGFIDMNNNHNNHNNHHTNHHKNHTNNTNNANNANNTHHNKLNLMDNDADSFGSKSSFDTDQQFGNTNAFNSNESFSNGTFDSWSSTPGNTTGANGNATTINTASSSNVNLNPFATGNLDKHIKHIAAAPPPHQQQTEETKRSKEALSRLIENITLSGIEIDYNEINVGEQIGNGAFAIVNRK